MSTAFTNTKYADYFNKFSENGTFPSFHIRSDHEEIQNGKVEQILQLVKFNRSTSTRRIDIQLGVPQT